MLDLSKYRVIDLSYELAPGERKIDGRYLHGSTFYDRPIEVQEFVAFGARMHFIQTQTHLGTHAECPYKYSDDGPDFADLPATAYMGEAVACNFTYKGAGEGHQTRDDFRQAGVKAGDIVLVWGSPDGVPRSPVYLRGGHRLADRGQRSRCWCWRICATLRQAHRQGRVMPTASCCWPASRWWMHHWG